MNSFTKSSGFGMATPLGGGGQGERRTGNRHLSVFKLARLVIGDHDQLCVIRNLSERGMMIQTHRPLRPEQRIAIEVRSDQCFPATVRWSRSNTAGVELDSPISVPELLQAAVTPTLRRGIKPRAPRFRRNAGAQIRLIDGRLATDLLDISLSGCCVRSVVGVHVRQIVTVQIAGLQDRRGEIRWIDHESTGIQFLQPLPLKDLDEWLVDNDDP